MKDEKTFIGSKMYYTLKTVLFAILLAGMFWPENGVIHQTEEIKNLSPLALPIILGSWAILLMWTLPLPMKAKSFLAIHLTKVVLPGLLLAAAVFPEYGMVANYEMAKEYPFSATMLVVVWGILVALSLPLTSFMFSAVTSFLVLAAIVAAHQIFGAAYPLDLYSYPPYVDVGVFFGWITLSRPIWKGYRGMVAVDDDDT